MMKQIHCIAGPTASGKSGFAVNLAKAINGEIINADALQVYEELQVLSARPTQEEMGGVAHHLYGCVSANTRYSTGAWLRDVEPLISDVLTRGKTPILVGGTGLYFKALTQGLAHIPTPKKQAVEQAQLILDRQGVETLRDKAQALDPKATNRVLGHDPQRLLRIVSVALGTKRPLSLWQEDTSPLIPEGHWRGTVLLPPREELYDKINRRFAGMVKQGGLAEAKKIHAMGLDRNLPAMKAIGVRELLQYLDGEYDLDFAIEKAMRETRRFAKRQYTWLRGNMQDWDVIDPFEVTE